MILTWLSAQVKALAEKDRLRTVLYQMSENDLKDIGLLRSDIEHVLKGRSPPTGRPANDAS